MIWSVGLAQEVLVLRYGLIGLGIAFFVLAAYLVITAMIARAETDTAPRDDMFVCDKHGMIPRKYALKLHVNNILGDQSPPVDYCPFCFEDKRAIARERLK